MLSQGQSLVLPGLVFENCLNSGLQSSACQNDLMRLTSQGGQSKQGQVMETAPAQWHEPTLQDSSSVFVTQRLCRCKQQKVKDRRSLPFMLGLGMEAGQTLQHAMVEAGFQEHVRIR